MPPNAKGKGGAGAGKRRARSDADEALEDSQAEVNDVSAVLSSPAAAAGESAGPPKSAGPPDGFLERRLAKEKTEKEQAIKEKELLEKQMDDMPALAGDDAVGINGGGGGRMGIHGKQVLEGPQSHRKRLLLNKPMKSVASNQKKS
jgi:hypothetical protein